MIKANAGRLGTLGKYPVTNAKYCCHTPEEYNKLTAAKKTSLKAWQDTPEGQAVKANSPGTGPQRYKKKKGKGNPKPKTNERKTERKPTTST